jgi:hypothetical protein
VRVRLGVFGKDWRGEWVGDGPDERMGHILPGFTCLIHFAVEVSWMS